MLEHGNAPNSYASRKQRLSKNGNYRKTTPPDPGANPAQRVPEAAAGKEVSRKAQTAQLAGRLQRIVANWPVAARWEDG